MNVVEKVRYLVETWRMLSPGERHSTSSAALAAKVCRMLAESLVEAAGEADALLGGAGEPLIKTAMLVERMARELMRTNDAWRMGVYRIRDQLWDCEVLLQRLDLQLQRAPVSGDTRGQSAPGGKSSVQDTEARKDRCIATLVRWGRGRDFGRTTKDLAGACGVNQRTIQRWVEQPESPLQTLWAGYRAADVASLDDPHWLDRRNVEFLQDEE